MAKEFGTIIKVGMNSTSFEASASEVNRKIRTLDSAFKAVSTEAKAFGETTDTLKQKQEILSQKVNIQSDRVKRLREQYEKSKKETGENSVATDKLALRYNNAVNSLRKMEGQLKGVNTKLDSQQKKFKLNGDKIKEFSKKAAKNIAIVTGAIAAMTAGALKLTKELGNAADRLLDLNSITGMSTDEIQKWQHAAVVAGTNLEAVTKASEKFTMQLNTLESEGNKSRKALRSLGISLSEIKDMNADERMNTLVEALQGVDDKTERARLGADLFGRQWAELAPIIDLGAKGLANAKSSADVFTPEQLEKANQFRITMDELKTRLKFVTMELAEKLLPHLNKLVDKIKEDMPKIKKIMKNVGDVVIPILSIVTNLILFLAKNIKIIIPLLTVIGSIIAGYKIYKTVDRIQKAAKAIGGLTGFLKNLNPAALKTTLIIMGVVAALIALVALITVLTGKTKDVERTFQSIGSGVGNLTNSVPRQLNVPQYATGTNYITEDQVAIVHKGEAIIPAQDNPYNPNAQKNGIGGDIFNVTIDAKNIKEFNDVVDMCKNLKQTKRQYAY